MKHSGEVEQRSLHQLNVALVTAPILRVHDFSRHFVLISDRFLVAAGAVLE